MANKKHMPRFEIERNNDIKCCNPLCKFCSEDPDNPCDAINGINGDPSYADCLSYLPEKLVEEKFTSNNSGSYKIPTFESFKYSILLKCNRSSGSYSCGEVLRKCHEYISRNFA